MSISAFAMNILRRSRRNQRHPSRSQAGFTLLELLIVTVIGGGLISGLMFIVIELLGTDRRESALTETQREMQLAMNYISDELREAVYVYTGEGLDGLIDRAQLGYLEANGSTPVIGFWKQEPFPEQVRNACNSSGVNSCFNAHSYALIIYSLQVGNDPNNIWQGEARVTRFAMTEYPQTGTTPNSGYVNPAKYKNNFATWPTDPAPKPPDSYSVPNDNRAVLVDFVSVERLEPLTSDPGDDLCPNPSDDPLTYKISPVNEPSRTFYACVRADSDVSVQDEVILYLQGNATGRPGVGGQVYRNSILPALETRVLTRGVLDRQS
jgi:prepilin-type N-terminal cleavage/methylation domain-containing protein